MHCWQVTWLHLGQFWVWSNSDRSSGYREKIRCTFGVGFHLVPTWASKFPSLALGFLPFAISYSNTPKSSLKKLDISGCQTHHLYPETVWWLIRRLDTAVSYSLSIQHRTLLSSGTNWLGKKDLVVKKKGEEVSVRVCVWEGGWGLRCLTDGNVVWLSSHDKNIRQVTDFALIHFKTLAFSISICWWRQHGSCSRRLQMTIRSDGILPQLNIGCCENAFQCHNEIIICQRRCATDDHIPSW